MSKPGVVPICCVKSKGSQFKNSFTITLNCTLEKKHCTEKRLEKNSNKYFFRSEFIVVCYSCEKELLKTSSCMSAKCFPPFCSTKRLRVLLKQLQLMMVHQKLHPQYYIMSPQCTRSSRHQRILQISHGILPLNFADMNHF